MLTVLYYTAKSFFNVLNIVDQTLIGRHSDTYALCHRLKNKHIYFDEPA